MSKPATALLYRMTSPDELGGYQLEALLGEKVSSIHSVQFLINAVDLTLAGIYYIPEGDSLFKYIGRNSCVVVAEFARDFFDANLIEGSYVLSRDDFGRVIKVHRCEPVFDMLKILDSAMMMYSPHYLTSGMNVSEMSKTMLTLESAYTQTMHMLPPGWKFMRIFNRHVRHSDSNVTLLNRDNAYYSLGYDYYTGSRLPRMLPVDPKFIAAMLNHEYYYLAYEMMSAENSNIITGIHSCDANRPSFSMSVISKYTFLHKVVTTQYKELVKFATFIPSGEVAFSPVHSLQQSTELTGHTSTLYADLVNLCNAAQYDSLRTILAVLKLVKDGRYAVPQWNLVKCIFEQ